jgi:hypothetical protein
MVEWRTYNTAKKALAETEILKDYKQCQPEAGEKAAIPRKQQDIPGKITGG